MSDLSDAALLARYRAGDDAALDALLLRYEAPLFQFMVGLLRDHHRAEDALQETFVRALERLDDVDPDHLRGWLFTVAYHQAMVLRRRGKTRAAAVLTEEAALVDADPADLAAREDDARRLQRLLGQLPAAQREVIRQRVYEGKRFRDIADALDCPLSTALARMHEGLKRLRLLWGEAMPDTDLAELARRYLAGALGRTDAAAFEDRLGADQAARDALCAAVGPVAPDPSYRRAVRRRLRAPLWRRLLLPRSYRGHPLLWGTAGAVAAVLLALLLRTEPPPAAPAVRPPAVEAPRTGPPADVAARPPEEDAEAAAARAWAERSVSDRLARAVEEANRRRVRAEDRRVAREEHGLPPFAVPMEKP